jgi:hypothetical protein
LHQKALRPHKPEEVSVVKYDNTKRVPEQYSAFILTGIGGVSQLCQPKFVLETGAVKLTKRESPVIGFVEKEKEIYISRIIQIIEGEHSSQVVPKSATQPHRFGKYKVEFSGNEQRWFAQIKEGKEGAENLPGWLRSQIPLAIAPTEEQSQIRAGDEVFEVYLTLNDAVLDMMFDAEQEHLHDFNLALEKVYVAVDEAIQRVGPQPTGSSPDSDFHKRNLLMSLHDCLPGWLKPTPKDQWRHDTPLAKIANDMEIRWASVFNQLCDLSKARDNNYSNYSHSAQRFAKLEGGEAATSTGENRRLSIFFEARKLKGNSEQLISEHNWLRSRQGSPPVFFW